MKGIIVSLLRLQIDEGLQAALTKATRWQLVMEEMLEVANSSEQYRLADCLKDLNSYLKAVTIDLPTPTPAQVAQWCSHHECYDHCHCRDN